MKKLFFFSILCFFVQFSFSQSAVQEQSIPYPIDDPKFAEFKKRHDDVTKSHNLASQSSSYYGYDETLKTYFLGNLIPSETPKSATYSTKSEYVKALNDWISKNKSLLKPEHKNVLITE